MHRDLHSTVLIRLVWAWLGLSVVLGTVTFYLEWRKADAFMHELAKAESRPLVDHIGQDGGEHLDALRAIASGLLQSGFIGVKVYDASQRKLLGSTEQDKAQYALGIGDHVHALPPGDMAHHHIHWIDRQFFVQMLLPLERAGSLTGYFEGVYAVPAQTARRIEAGILRTLVLVLIVISATAITVYPILMSLNKDLLKLSRDLLSGNVELMDVLGSAIAKRDSHTDAHNHRVTVYAIRLAQALHLSRDNIRRLVAGAFLHDVGKVGIDDAILRKPGRLTDEEMKIMRGHVALGVEIIAKADWLQSAQDVVEFHHEKFDGSGYVKGLKGAAIPLNARIFAIADCFDALTSRRSYKDPIAFDEALAVMRRGAGFHLDPYLFKAFEAMAAKLYAEIGNAPPAAVEGELRLLIHEYYLSVDNVQRRSSRQPSDEANLGHGSLFE